jgi:HSP20 family protein
MNETTMESRSGVVRRDQTDQPAPEHVKTGAVTYGPPTDVYDLGDRYEMLLDVPGATRESIDISVAQGVLTVHAGVPTRVPADATPLRAEYGVGDFRRQVRLGEDVDTERLTASYADGVLTIGLPKSAGRRARRVEVRAG